MFIKRKDDKEEKKYEVLKIACNFEVSDYYINSGSNRVRGKRPDGTWFLIYDEYCGFYWIDSSSCKLVKEGE
jgi:hypothetical protein